MGVINPFAPASMAPANADSSQGCATAVSNRLEVPAPLQQLFVLAGSGFSIHDPSRVV